MLLAPLNIGLATTNGRRQNRQAWSTLVSLVGTVTSSTEQASWSW